MSVIVSKNILGNGVSGDEANKQLFIAFLALFSLIVLAQGNLDEAAIDLDGAVDVQKRGADDVVAIKTYDFPSLVKSQCGCKSCPCRPPKKDCATKKCAKRRTCEMKNNKPKCVCDKAAGYKNIKGKCVCDKAAGDKNIKAQGNLDEAAIDLDGAVDVQKRGADDVVAIKTYDIPSRAKRADCQPTYDCYTDCTGCNCITTCVAVENSC